MTLTCPVCGTQFTYSYKHRRYCSRMCYMKRNYARERERRKRDPSYAEKREQYRRRHIERTRKYAERAVSALDEDSKALLALLLTSRGSDGYNKRLLRDYYARPTLFGVLREIERREGC